MGGLAVEYIGHKEKLQTTRYTYKKGEYTLYLRDLDKKMRPRIFIIPICGPTFTWSAGGSVSECWDIYADITEQFVPCTLGLRQMDGLVLDSAHMLTSVRIDLNVPEGAEVEVLLHEWVRDCEELAEEDHEERLYKAYKKGLDLL
jgi:hypothetical protein